ncbi:MAG: [LysW]-aminoadipate kinase [Rhodothermaceae bacterium]
MIIIKIGGGKNINLEGIVENLSELDEQFIIVHGANALRDELLEELGIEKKVVTSVSGYSSVFSDEKALDVMMMAYAGLKNKRLVELCQQNGINAVGLSGLDGKMIQGKRNNGIRVKENGKLRILRDFSGKPKSVNKELLHLLLEKNYAPVLCVPIIDENGYAINSENDDIVSVLTNQLNADKVISLIEAPGFMEDVNDENSVVKEINYQELEKREEQVDGRMKRKILALRKLFETAKPTVYISDGRRENPVLDALNQKGTIIK